MLPPVASGLAGGPSRSRWTPPPGLRSSGACATTGTLARRTRVPASQDYARNLLRPAGVTPRLLRCTRLASLTLSTDPKLVSAAFGIHPQAATHYLAGHVDDARLHGTDQTAPAVADSWPLAAPERLSGD